MKFEEALQNFNTEIAKEYGPGHEVTKIGLSNKLFEAVLYQLYSRPNYSYVQIPLTSANLGEFRLFDVEIVVRNKDKF